LPFSTGPNSAWTGLPVADVAYVFITIAVFALLALLVRGLEKL